MSRDLTKAMPVLQEFFPKFKAQYEEFHPNTEVFITHVDRTPVEQLLLFVQGRLPAYSGQIITWKDGFVGKSKHNALPLSEAIDLGVRVNGKITWDASFVNKVGAIVQDLGYGDKIKWGGIFWDNYHFETKECQ